MLATLTAIAEKLGPAALSALVDLVKAALDGAPSIELQRKAQRLAIANSAKAAIHAGRLKG